MTVLGTDYLVVGAGATAMAFVDTLLSESPRARILMVDKRGGVGGHWIDAYPFVRLHGPAAWYGVASRELATWTKEPSGPNQGMYSLPSGTEVLAHFECVMRDRFLASGRVEWLPKTEYGGVEGGVHVLRSILSGEVHEVRVDCRRVLANHTRPEIPSTHEPRYKVMPGVRCVPPNDLPRLERPAAHYTVVGAGKTGMDACIWLLENGVAPQRIRWIMPRDSWLLDRANMQPGVEGFERGMRNAIAQFEAIAQAKDLKDLFRILEERQVLMRMDSAVVPTMYRCAVVSRGELGQLRRIEDVVRLGRLQAIEPARLLFEHRTIEADPDTLYVNCSAAAIQPLPQLRIFDGDAINLLMVRWCNPLFSAALIAWVESHVEGESAKNALCGVVPGPHRPIDWLRMWDVSLRNGAAWRGNAALQAWLSQCRLNNLVAMLKGVEMTPAVKNLLQEVAAKSAVAEAKLPQLLALGQDAR